MVVTVTESTTVGATCSAGLLIKAFPEDDTRTLPLTSRAAVSTFGAAPTSIIRLASVGPAAMKNVCSTPGRGIGRSSMMRWSPPKSIASTAVPSGATPLTTTSPAELPSWNPTPTPCPSR